MQPRVLQEGPDSRFDSLTGLEFERCHRVTSVRRRRNHCQPQQHTLIPVICSDVHRYSDLFDSCSPRNEPHELPRQPGSWANAVAMRNSPRLGHTDASGTEEYNLLLSHRRAKAVEKILIDAGISKHHLVTRALGEQEPLENLPVQSEKNRRASIRIMDLEECINPLISGDSN